MAYRLNLRLQPDDPVILPLVGSSRSMREVARQVELLARGDGAPVLLSGEAGTGKGRVAECIHARSDRSSEAFAAINCAGGDPSETGASLFGDIDGAAGTGRADDTERAPGLFGAVGGGTIFAEEVADLSADLQVRLLRELDGAVCPGSAGQHPVPRVIAASTSDLVNEVNSGRFREDLYYRLSTAPVHLPPLRARSRDDLSELITATFNALSMNMPHTPRTLDDDVVDNLVAYPWPGNIRELQNALEWALLAARGQAVLRRMHLPVELQHAEGSDVGHTPRTLADVERAHIHRTLRAHKLNRTHAARELGISRATLIKKIKEYGLVQRGAGRA